MTVMSLWWRSDRAVWLDEQWFCALWVVLPGRYRVPARLIAIKNSLELHKNKSDGCFEVTSLYPRVILAHFNQKSYSKQNDAVLTTKVARLGTHGHHVSLVVLTVAGLRCKHCAVIWPINTRINARGCQITFRKMVKRKCIRFRANSKILVVEQAW